MADEKETEQAIYQATTDLLDYYIGACFRQAERKGYQGAELDKLKWVLVVTRADLPHEFYVNPPRRVDPDVYPDEEPQGQSS